MTLSSDDWPVPTYVAVVPGRPVIFTDDGYEAMCWARANGGMAVRVRDGHVIQDASPKRGAPAPATALPSTDDARKVPWTERALAIAQENGSVAAHDLVALGCKESNAYQSIANLRDRGHLIPTDERGRYVVPSANVEAATAPEG